MNTWAKEARQCVYWVGVCLLASVLSLSGCATREQVKQIVSESNAHLLARQFPDAQLLVKQGDAEADDVVRRIDDFIAEHPDQKALNGSLRVRQAVIYLNRKEYNLASAALDAAKPFQPLRAARDDALVNVRESFVWWYENSDSALFGSPEQVDRAERVRDAFNQEAKKRASSPDIRDFLAEAGAWAGLKSSASASSADEQKRLLESTINDYAFIFDAADLEWLCHPVPVADKVDVQTMRRRVRAEKVLAEGSRMAARMEAALKPVFTQPLIQGMVSPDSKSPSCDQRRPD